MYKKSPVEIEFWEFLALFFFLALIGIIHSRKQRMELPKHPEYRFYITGLFAKVFGSVIFSLIYVYYYGNGDTISYFTSSIPLVNLMIKDPIEYIYALFATNSIENKYRFFDSVTGYPIGYVYHDARTYVLVRIISPLTAIMFKSFLLTGALVAVVAYQGVWRLYTTLVHYYPKIQGQLAFAILFFPSTLFWGGGIMKDTFTFTAVCWYIHGLDNIFFQKTKRTTSWLGLIAAASIMIAMKPYVFMMIFPASLLWLLYHRVAKLRNALLRTLALPMAFVVLGGLTIFTLQSLGDRLSKFSLDRALETIIVTQQDMKRSEQYGNNYFDLGEIEATWSSVFSKFPAATFAGLFRPSLLDTTNVVILLTALENTWLLLFFVATLLRTRLIYFLTLLRVNPLLQMFYLFAFGYAFVVGVTTPNFGAMVRFKIPLLPLFVAGLFITSHIMDLRKKVLNSGGRFDFARFTDGDPGEPYHVLDKGHAARRSVLADGKTASAPSPG